MTLKRIVTMTAVALALAIPATSGFAQSPAAPTATPTPAAPIASPSAAPPAATPAPRAGAPATTTTAAATPAARHMRDGEMRASKLIGSSIYDSSDQKIGSVADLVLDRDGKISDVVVGVGTFLGTGDKLVAVKMAELKRGKDNRLVLNATKDALKQMATYDLNYDAAARSGSSTHK